MSSTNGKTSAGVLTDICRALYPDDPSPHIRLANRLGVKTQTAKYWLSGKSPIGRTHPAWGKVEALLRQREDELHSARVALEAWRSG
jgi:hypothetical protein